MSLPRALDGAPRAQTNGMLAEDFGKKNLTLLPRWRELVGEPLIPITTLGYSGDCGLTP